MRAHCDVPSAKNILTLHFSVSNLLSLHTALYSEWDIHEIDAPVSISAGIVYLQIFTFKAPFSSLQVNTSLTIFPSDTLFSLEDLHLALDLSGLNGRDFLKA